MDQEMVAQYQVVGTDGQIYPPVNVTVLKAWAADGRLSRDMMIIDVLTTLPMRAEDMLAGHDVFPPKVPPIHPLQASGGQSAPAAGAQMLVFQTSTTPALTPAPLLVRLGAFLIDVLCGLPLVFASAIPFLGILFAPLLCLYWLSRDAFGGRSIGKRILNLQAVRADGKPFNWGNSAARNLIYISMLVMMIPFIGDALVPVCVGLPGLLDIILVLATNKRLGDHLGNTLVVASQQDNITPSF